MHKRFAKNSEKKLLITISLNMTSHNDVSELLILVIFYNKELILSGRGWGCYPLDSSLSLILYYEFSKILLF